VNGQPGINVLADHLFRHEYGKLVSILTGIFGPEHLQLAEDVVQDCLVEAIGHWSYEGVPDNPAAWLFRVAKNKALNIVNREKYKRQYISELTSHQKHDWTEPTIENGFSEEQILDDQLRMIFTCCHPSISTDSQIALALKTLCGFSIPEIAKAFLTTEETLNKRLVRARQKIREARIPFEVPHGSRLRTRMKAVLETIYLLFNEGYSASRGEDVIRYDLCGEAIRLAELIERHPAIQDKSELHALLALMQLNASRFNGRQDDQGNLLTLEEQDRSKWNLELITKGILNLKKSIDGSPVSGYQVLATISAHHSTAHDFESTDWDSILQLYDNLVQIDSSPVVLLNRAVALSKVKGPGPALQELDNLNGNLVLRHYHLYYSTKAEFNIQLGQYSDALESLGKAINLAALDAEKKLIRGRIQSCQRKMT
jgi:RNA polymerase sigma-70 factor (ECF subfamily)